MWPSPVHLPLGYAQPLQFIPAQPQIIHSHTFIFYLESSNPFDLAAQSYPEHVLRGAHIGPLANASPPTREGATGPGLNSSAYQLSRREEPSQSIRNPDPVAQYSQHYHDDSRSLQRAHEEPSQPLRNSDSQVIVVPSPSPSPPQHSHSPSPSNTPVVPQSHQNVHYQVQSQNPAPEKSPYHSPAQYHTPTDRPSNNPVSDRPLQSSSAISPRQDKTTSFRTTEDAKRSLLAGYGCLLGAADRLSGVDPISEIIDDFFWIGSLYAAKEVNLMDNRRITHIISLTKYGDNARFLDETRFSYLVLELHGTEEKILPYFQRVFDFIDNCKTTRSRVFMHCKNGESLSPAFAIGYLMKAQTMSFQDAHMIVKIRRPCIDLSTNFKSQLLAYEMEVFGKIK